MRRKNLRVLRVTPLRKRPPSKRGKTAVLRKGGASPRFIGHRTRAGGRAFAFIIECVRARPKPDGFGFARVSEVLRVTPIRFLLAMALAAAFAAPAFADCGQDMQKLAEARNVEMQKLNTFVKQFHGKPMDPAGFCVTSVGLLRAEDSLIAYMSKNKDWCSFPDEALNNLKAGHAKSVAFNAKACQVAAQIKKMKEQAAQGGGGPQAAPLPAGPL